MKKLKFSTIILLLSFMMISYSVISAQNHLGIFCASELVNDLQNYFGQNNIHIREYVLPEGGFYFHIITTGANNSYPHEPAEKYHLDVNEFRVLHIIDEAISSPAISHPIYAQISSIPDRNGYRHVESLCIFLQEYTSQPLIKPWAPIGRMATYPAEYQLLLKKLSVFTELKYLELFGFEITTEQDMKKIAALPQLTYLGLPYNCDDKQLKIISAMDNLQYLNASSTHIKGPGLRYISDMRNLEVLDLRHTHLRIDGLATLKQKTSVRTILLSDTNTQDDDLIYLSHIQSIQYMSLHNTDISDEGIKYLEKMNRLKYISLYDTNVSLSRIKLLQQNRPDLKIDFIRPALLSYFLKERSMIYAKLNDMDAQFSNLQSSGYEPNISFEDTMETLKWYIIALKYIQANLGQDIKNKTARVEYIKQQKANLESCLSLQQIKNAHKRADVVFDIIKNSTINLTHNRCCSMPIYQYYIPRVWVFPQGES